MRASAISQYEKVTPVICEICVDSVAGIRAAKAAGAARVELCGDLLEGGTTPSLGMIREARKIAGVGLNVMIRPRGGDFLFDEDEFAIMEADIDAAKTEDADGVVIGLLTADGAVDVKRTRELIARARPLSVTFHRAFDMTPDPFEALETLVGLGVDRVLTAGQEASVLEGLPLIAELVRRAGGRIIVMPGGLSGLDLAHAVREHHNELPLVLASGYSDRANEALRAGFVLLPKPYTSAALAEAIETARTRGTDSRRQRGA